MFTWPIRGERVANLLFIFLLSFMSIIETIRISGVKHYLLINHLKFVFEYCMLCCVDKVVFEYCNKICIRILYVVLIKLSE